MDEDEKRDENPFETATILSKLLFRFAIPIFCKGCQQDLREEDLYRPLQEHKSDYISAQLNKAWEEECVQKLPKHQTPSLLNVLWRVFGLRFIGLGVVLLTIELGLRVTQPLYLDTLITYYTVSEFESHGSSSHNQTFSFRNHQESLGVSWCAWAMVLCCAGNVFLMHPYMFFSLHTGMKLRVSMCGLIYRKALRLNRVALRTATCGQFINLISNDLSRLDTSLLHIHYLWLGPLEIAIVTYLMYQEIGMASVFGVLVMVLFLPLQVHLGRMSSSLRRKSAVLTDERVRFMNELINGIEVIKLYVWELPFIKRITRKRNKELNIIRLANFIRGTLQSFILFLTRISVFVSLLGYVVIMDDQLTARKAFVLTAYYNILRTTMTVYFPMGISQMAETLVSIQRIQVFMMQPEVQRAALHGSIHCRPAKLSRTFSIDDGQDALIISKLKAKWQTNSSEYTLYNVHLNVKACSTVAIIGPVGSGKSSLIQAILGELLPISGAVLVNGTVSYACQEPWLFPGTIRQNILFGMPMDKQRYHAVIRKCALDKDLEDFVYGDRTMIGERGKSLSGGQRARISLARAVYRKADIYLLDDPLSSVDVHVAHHLFEQCIRGFLRNNTVVLVTHQMQLIEKLDLVVLMKKGRIHATGNLTSLRLNGYDFVNLMDFHQMDRQQSNSNSSSSIHRRSGGQFQDRQISVTSCISTDSESFTELMQSAKDFLEETGGTDNRKKITTTTTTTFHLYRKYFLPNGSHHWLLFVAVIFFGIGAQLFACVADVFLANWVNQSDDKSSSSIIIQITPNMMNLFTFTGLNVMIVVFALMRTFTFFQLAMKSSLHLHNEMFQGVLRTSMYFFRVNPVGRILNRFSNDLNQVDELLPSVLMDVIQIFLAIFGVVIVLGVVNPWHVVSITPLAIITFYLRGFYLRTSQSLNHLLAKTRSPMYTHLAVSLNGLSTIRALKAQENFIEQFDRYQDLHSSGHFLFLTISRAFGYWLDCCCIVYLAVITLSLMLLPTNNGGEVGLALTQAMGLTGMVQWGMRRSAELENLMMAVNRIGEYGELEQEDDDAQQSNKTGPSKSWPEHGAIRFQRLSLRYIPPGKEKSDCVLKCLSFEVKPYEKIGIVGRTGAGKSSLINALFRLSYIEGDIFIDHWNTKDLRLSELRRKISIIPQEPVLFSGTLRYNLDPFEEYSDAKLWDSLEEVKLKVFVTHHLAKGLYSEISEGGSNFSVGQRQLVCLARAILRENRILVMDEATASVDPQTGLFIQTTIRRKFKHCTVLTVAHRLHTILDSDRILVMDSGRIVEYGSPFELLMEETSTKVFHDMVKEATNGAFEGLLKMVQKAHEENLRQTQQDTLHLMAVSNVFKNYLWKILEPITKKHPANLHKLHKSMFFDQQQDKEKF